MKNDECLILLKLPVDDQEESDTMRYLPPMCRIFTIFLKEKHGFFADTCPFFLLCDDHPIPELNVR